MYVCMYDINYAAPICVKLLLFILFFSVFLSNQMKWNEVDPRMLKMREESKKGGNKHMYISLSLSINKTLSASFVSSFGSFSKS